MDKQTALYLSDSYQKELKTKIKSITQKGDMYDVVLEETIFYPEGGGQPADKGLIKGKNGEAHVKDVRFTDNQVIQRCTVTGHLNELDEVQCTINWTWRYNNMRRHSAGHLLHEAVTKLYPELKPVKGNHFENDSYIEYTGNLDAAAKEKIEKETNDLVKAKLNVTTEFVTYDELVKHSSFVPEHLPKNKPLRILQIEGFSAIPDGGTQVKNTEEIEKVIVTKIENTENKVRVYYAIEESLSVKNYYKKVFDKDDLLIKLNNLEKAALEESKSIKTIEELNNFEVKYLLSSNSTLSEVSKQIVNSDKIDRPTLGKEINQKKGIIKNIISNVKKELFDTSNNDWLDVTAPGMKPPEGHLHIVSLAMQEITEIFEKIGFTRVRYPEIEWEWYSFESLNMPANHPARDDFETFFVDLPSSPKFGKVVLSPHTSSGQVREMERLNHQPPVRMINIAKCYRPNWDVSHVPMFHQFEGLVVDEGINITHLKGTMDYFAKQFFGPERKTRLRPFHFQFTEPSFEVDINCAVCLGSGKLSDGSKCRMCKEGWLELGGSGMVHPNVLKAGKIDTKKYTGFAFGWGIERTYMMKSETKLDDIRQLYGNDLRFLEQF